MSRKIFDGEVKVIDKVKPRRVKRSKAIKAAAEKAYKGIKEERFAFGDQRSEYEKNEENVLKSELIAWTDNPWMDLTKPETIKEVHHYVEFYPITSGDSIYIRFLDKTRRFMFLMKDRNAVIALRDRLASMVDHLDHLLKKIK